MIPVIHDLKMVRGDTLSFDLTLDEIPDNEITSVFFTVKKVKNDENPVFQKLLGDGIELVEEQSYRIRIAPEDSYDIEAGKYYYDLQLGIGNDIYTPLMGRIEFIQDVTVMHYASTD